MQTMIVRFGVLGHVGRFVPLDGRPYPRGTEVVCETRRGLEIGKILAGVEAAPALDAAGKGAGDVPSTISNDGTIVRAVTTEDRLLRLRLQQRRAEAIATCESLLTERGLAVTLIDVDQTLDGGSLVFYFLGEISPEVDRVTEQLAATYEQTVQLKRFSELLENGCGPHCGTEEASGCGSHGGCSTCSLACGVRH